MTTTHVWFIYADGRMKRESVPATAIGEGWEWHIHPNQGVMQKPDWPENPRVFHLGPPPEDPMVVTMRTFEIEKWMVPRNRVHMASLCKCYAPYDNSYIHRALRPQFLYRERVAS